MLTNVKVIQDEEPLTAETVAKNFGMEDCDDFMTALRDTIDEED